MSIFSKKRLILYAFLALLFFTCKKKENPEGPIPEKNKEVAEFIKLKDTLNAKFLEYAFLNPNDPITALIKTRDFIAGFSEIEKAYIDDEVVLKVVYKSGFDTHIYLNILDNNGEVIYRGGGRNGGVSRALPTCVNGDCINALENKKILIYSPRYKEFYSSKKKSYKYIIDLIKNEGNGFTVDTLIEESATVEAISQFNNYGIVIIDTHGQPDAFLTGDEVINLRYSDWIDYIDSVAWYLENKYMGKSLYRAFINHQVRIGSTYNINVNNPNWVLEYLKRPTSDYYSEVWFKGSGIQSLPNLDKTIVVGNFCYSGWTKSDQNHKVNENIGSGFISKNILTYYGHANPDGSANKVDNIFAIDMEDSIIFNLLVKKKCSGISHLKAKGSEFQDPFYGNYFKHFLKSDYCYTACAVPLVDSRDGNTYSTFCFGKQIWMAENLRYNAVGSVAYLNDSTNIPKYGKLYDWTTVMNGSASYNKLPGKVRGICPAGWHLPTQLEWNKLLDSLGGINVSNKLKSTSGWQGNGNGDNTTGFNALPAGIFDYAFSVFTGLNQSAMFWSSTESELDPQNRAYYLYLSYIDNRALLNYSWKQTKGSCRCIKD